MEKTRDQAEQTSGVQGRSFAKGIAELALTLELTGQAESATALEAAAGEFAQGRGIPRSTLKRCASEARALIEHAHSSGAVAELVSRSEGEEWRLQQALAAWLDETSLPAVLKQRALRLNRSRGGRPSSQTRTLRAVEELLEFARAGRPDALDELRSIRALFDTDRAPLPSRS
ncbi:MAG: hypothetical protein ACJ798_19525 [Phenylobacterium sp.]